MKLGFTGTREQPTAKQLIVMQEWLTSTTYGPAPYTQIEEAHHGCCVGSDYAFHTMMKEWLVGDKIHLHPPDDAKLEMPYTTWDYGNCIWSPKKPYMVRNSDIVNESDMLIVMPKEDHEVSRSGTWATYRMAKYLHKPRFIIYPDGESVYDISVIG